MKKLTTFFCLSSLISGLALTAVAEQSFVLSSSGDGITVFEADGESGKLTEIQTVPDRGLMAITKDQRRVYAIGTGIIATYNVEEDGKLRMVGKAEIEGSGGYADLDATERYFATNNYGQGTATVWKIGVDGIVISEPTAHVTLEQKAHSSVFAPGNNYLLVPATGPNKVFQLKFDVETGKIIPSDPPSAPAPMDEGEAQQPRHLVFHPNGKIAYTTLERELPGVGVWEWDAQSGSLKVVQNIVTYPEGFDGVITTADLHLTPEAKFLYVSNRDITDRKAVVGNSSIVGFKVLESGHLEMIGHTLCEQVPRSFAVDRAGKFLYVAGQTAAKIGVYAINEETGELTQVEQLNTGDGPNWIQCITLE
jgi:6-phosphogluconolactonase